MIKRLVIFLVVSILVLPIGYVAAQLVWYRFHHRYESPQTGLYHGYVSVLFDGLEEPLYWLHFQGESSPRWYWRQPTNFSYTTLEVKWYDDSAERHATVSLPAFTYRAGGVSGVLTREVLAGWLCGAVTNRISDTKHLDTMFTYFEAAAGGCLPPPRHHTYYLEEPVGVRVQHFLLGYGFGGTVYIWLGVWSLLVVVIGRNILRRNREG